MPIPSNQQLFFEVNPNGFIIFIMNNQRNPLRSQNTDTLPKHQASGKTPSPARRKKIFAEDESEAMVRKSRNQENAQKNGIIDEIYKTIENINWKLQDFNTLQQQNKSLKVENDRLRSLIDQNAEINILKKEKTELEGKLYDYKKRLQKAKLMVELLFAGQKSKHTKELQEFQSIFDV